METLAVFLPALRELRRNRRPPAVAHEVFFVPSTDGVELFCTLIRGDTERAVVVCHPAITGSYYLQVVSLAEELSRSFSTLLFDFRGHGRSTGRCPVGFGKVSEDLESVVDRVSGMGFQRIGVAGFSMGAAAAFVLSSRNDCIDSLVSIGCPPGFPDLPLLDRHPRLTRGAVRLLGMRMDTRPDDGPTPMEVAASLAGFPKLLIFGEYEVVPPEEISDFTEMVPGPKEAVTIPGVWHADLSGRESVVREWFEKTL